MHLPDMQYCTYNLLVQFLGKIQMYYVLALQIDYVLFITSRWACLLMCSDCYLFSWQSHLWSCSDKHDTLCCVFMIDSLTIYLWHFLIHLIWFAVVYMIYCLLWCVMWQLMVFEGYILDWGVNFDVRCVNMCAYEFLGTYFDISNDYNHGGLKLYRS